MPYNLRSRKQSVIMVKVNPSGVTKKSSPAASTFSKRNPSQQTNTATHLQHQAISSMVPLAAKSSNDSPEDPSQNQDFDKIIQILVGPEKKSYIAHKWALIEIPFFKNCLRSDMQEAMSGQVLLPQDDPVAFLEVMRFAYSRDMSYNLPKLYEAHHKDGTLLDADPLTEKFLLTIKVYLLADKLGLESLQNQAIDMLRLSTRYQRFFPKALTLIEKNTKENDKLLELAMDCKAADITTDGWDKWSKGVTYPSWVDGNFQRAAMVMAAQDRRRTRGAPCFGKNHCQMRHTHVDTSPCANRP